MSTRRDTRPTGSRGAQQYGAPTDPQRGQGASDNENAQQYGSSLRDSTEPGTKKEDPSPSGVVVTKFHKNADTDSRAEAIHHTLGNSPTQASPGNHTHDGSSSPLILQGMVLSGAKATPSTMWPSIIAALVRLGAKDSTT